MKKKYSAYGISALLVLAGIGHFIHPFLFLKMMPRPFPYPLEMVYLSGSIEIMLGIFLCIASWRKMAAWGIIALLIAVFPANIFMALHTDEWTIAPWLLYLRLPLQFLLIFWAYQHTQKSA